MLLWQEIEIIEELRKIRKLLEKLVAEEATYILTIHWHSHKKGSIMSDVQLNLTPPFGNNVGVPAETKNGQPFTFDPTKITWAVQDPSIVSFVVNNDGSATFTPLVAGATGVAVQDTATGAQSTGTLTVVQAQDKFTLDINWTAPVTQ